MPDLIIHPGPGVPDGMVVPSSAVTEQFSRASGPGGQGVNTTDSRVQVSVDLAALELTTAQRDRVNRALAGRIRNGRLRVAAAEHRSQRLNRRAARDRLGALLRAALAPPPPVRRSTGPSPRAVERRLAAKRARALVKARRSRPTASD
ncbi:MAG: alternative ribosome rescue aminoacyl-tRNA hydrolase ArfB [Propioniciclava sp.]